MTECATELVPDHFFVPQKKPEDIAISAGFITCIAIPSNISSSTNNSPQWRDIMGMKNDFNVDVYQHVTYHKRPQQTTPLSFNKNMSEYFTNVLFVRMFSGLFCHW